MRRFEPPPHVTVQLQADQLPTQSTGSVLQVAPSPQPATPGEFSRNVLQPAGRGQSKSLPSAPRVTYDIQQLSRLDTMLQTLDGTSPVSKLRIMYLQARVNQTAQGQEHARARCTECGKARK